MERILGFITLPGGWEWVLLLVVIVVILAPKGGSKLIGTIGRGLREFTDAKKDITRALEDEVADVFEDVVSPDKPQTTKKHRKAAKREREHPSVRGE